MARRQLKSPRSLSGRSIHMTLVIKWSWSWSWMTYCHPLCAMSIGPPILRYSYFKIWPWKIHGQGHVCGQRSRSCLTFKIQRSRLWSRSTHWSHLRPGDQSICLLFVSWQSDHFWLRYSKFYIWPWQFKVKVMAKVKPDGHIWALEFNRYCCFSFRVNRTIFGWDIANSIFDLGQGHNENRPKSNQVIYRSGPTIVPKMKEIQKVVQKLSLEQESTATPYELVQKHSHPRYIGVT